MWELVVKGLGLYVVMAIVSAITAFAGSTVLGVILSGLLYIAFVVLMYAEGASAGEHQVGISDMVSRLRQEGKQPDARLLKSTYDPKKGICAFLILSLPLVALAVVNLILAPSSANENTLGIITRVVFLPQAFLTVLLNSLVKLDISGAMEAGKAVLRGIGYDGLDINGIIAATGKVGTYAFASDTSSLTLMRILYIPFSVLPPLAMLFGYLQGPRLRKRTLDAMMSGSRKKQRRMKKQNRGFKPAKPEI